MSFTYQVSIIVPVYNVEKYIEKCVQSLLKQDFEGNIEYIFVDDKSPDKSIEILEKIIKKYPKKEGCIHIIRHTKNKGLSAARKTGLKKSHGEYIIHIDSDDWCDLNMISEMYKKAKETNASIVCCDYFENYQKEEIYKKQNYSSSSYENQILLLHGAVSPSTCDKLVKRELYFKHNIFPLAGMHIAEDRLLMIQLFLVAKNIVYLPKAFFHYRKNNPDSIMHNVNNKVWDDLKTYTLTIQKFLDKKGLNDKYKKHFLIGLLGLILGFAQGYKYKERVNDICPEADKLKYLWKNSSKSLLAKIGFSFSMIYMGFMTKWLIQFEGFLKGKK
ncbi:glycosyltransferase [Candidatus Gracilibacteria bacterium]|nr:MAG: glycosyltransferase [Candidatus Gracilibacteria bacterium]